MGYEVLRVDPNNKMNADSWLAEREQMELDDFQSQSMAGWTGANIHLDGATTVDNLKVEWVMYMSHKLWVIIHLPLMACCWVGNVCVSPANPWTFGKSACGVASEGVCLTLKIASKTINIHENITYSEERLDDVIPNREGLNHFDKLEKYIYIILVQGYASHKYIKLSVLICPQLTLINASLLSLVIQSDFLYLFEMRLTVKARICYKCNCRKF